MDMKTCLNRTRSCASAAIQGMDSSPRPLSRVRPVQDQEIEPEAESSLAKLLIASNEDRIRPVSQLAGIGPVQCSRDDLHHRMAHDSRLQGRNRWLHLDVSASDMGSRSTTRWPDRLLGMPGSGWLTSSIEAQYARRTDDSHWPDRPFILIGLIFAFMIIRASL